MRVIAARAPQASFSLPARGLIFALLIIAVDPFASSPRIYEPMGRSSHSPIWPFLIVVGLLFLLSIFAPREWEHIARRQAMPNLLNSPRARISRQEMPAAPPVEAVAADEQNAGKASSHSHEAVNDLRREPELAPPQSIVRFSPTDPATIYGPSAVENQPTLAPPQESRAPTPSEPEPSAPVDSLSSTVPSATPEPDYYANVQAAPVAEPEPEATESPALAAQSEAQIAPASVEPTPDAAQPTTSQVVESPSHATAAAEQSASAAATESTSQSVMTDADASQPDVTSTADSSTSATDDQQSTAESATPAGPRWAPPVDLLRRVEALASNCDCSGWAEEVGQLIIELTNETCPSDARAAEIVARLRALSAGVEILLPAIGDRQTSVNLLRVRHALARRLDIWELIPPMMAHPARTTSPGKVAADRLSAAVVKLDEITGRAGDEGQQWQRYLALDSLRALARGEGMNSDAERQRLAREIERRLHRAGLTDGQRTFVASPAVVELASALRPYAWSGLDPLTLLADVEQFEDTNRPADARRLADDYWQSTFASATAGRLSERLEANYRNANVRVALSEKLLQRLAPPITSSTDAVRDNILGAATRGVSTSSTKVEVKLVPDDRRLRVALEATGTIFSNTRSTSGPATVHTHGDARYHARKVIDLDLRGIRTFPAECECLENHSRLRSVSTDFDAVPLVGTLVENLARSRHADQQGEIRSVVRRKIETQARSKIDAMTQERLDEVNRELQDRLIKPLEHLALDPQVISAETSEQRLTMRLRIAGEEQLGGHTPRPRAPSDSLLSLQLHQSLFNNVCEQLGLNGRTYRLPALREHVVEALHLVDNSVSDADEQANVSITFAAENAVRIRCEEGRIELTLSVARLSDDEHVWKNFTVRVYYQPQIEGLQATLMRDGTVQLIGERLSTRSQVALRSVFSKVFAKDRGLELVGPQIASDPRIRDLEFTQFVIQDGWVAVAVAEPRDNIAGKPKAAAPR